MLLNVSQETYLNTKRTSIYMKRYILTALKIITLFLALFSAYWLIRSPLVEGRAVGLDVVSIYLDPFVIYFYLASIPFFVFLFQAYTLFILLQHGKNHSRKIINKLRIIKYCTLLQIVLIIIGATIIISTSTEGNAGFLSISIVACVLFGGFVYGVSFIEKSVGK